MKKLITNADTIGSDVVISLCDCGCSDHLLRISRDREERNEYFFSIVPVSKSFFYRIKDAFHLVFHGSHVDEIILERKEVKDLAETLLQLVYEER